MPELLLVSLINKFKEEIKPITIEIYSGFMTILSDGGKIMIYFAEKEISLMTFGECFWGRCTHRKNGTLASREIR